MKKIVFSDIDGTLLNDQHKVSDNTIKAIKQLQKNNIPFVIVSARSPSGIYPILEENNFNCEIISYSGGLILDEHRNITYSKGFKQEYAQQIINFIEEEQLDLTWNIYSNDNWIVKDKSDSRVIREENIVHAQSSEGNLDSLSDDAIVNKILCMCNPEKINAIEELLKFHFDQVNISKSSDILIEINGLNITKAEAVEIVCHQHEIDINDAIAFGDNFNDQDMLLRVGHPYLMDNAPLELKKLIKTHTLSNNEDGIYYALKQLNII